MKKFLLWSGVGFLVFFIAFRPNEASNVVEKIVGVIVDIAMGFAEFVIGLVT